MSASFVQPASAGTQDFGVRGQAVQTRDCNLRRVP